MVQLGLGRHQKQRNGLARNKKKEGQWEERRDWRPFIHQPAQNQNYAI